MVCELYLNIERRENKYEYAHWHSHLSSSLPPGMFLIGSASENCGPDCFSSYAWAHWGPVRSPGLVQDHTLVVAELETHIPTPLKGLLSFPWNWRPWSAIGSKTYTSFFLFLMSTWPLSSTPIREQTPIIPNRVTAAHPDGEAGRPDNFFSPSLHRVQGTAWDSLTSSPLPSSFSPLSVSLTSPFYDVSNRWELTLHVVANWKTSV